MLDVPWSSKMGENVVPALVVFHTPPYAVATYHMLLSRGFTARSVMRPDVFAGPIERNLRPENVEAVSFDVDLASDFVDDLFDEDLAELLAPDLGAGAATDTPATNSSARSACGKRFMGGAVLVEVHGRPRGGAGRARSSQWNECAVGCQSHASRAQAVRAASAGSPSEAGRERVLGAGLAGGLRP
jgi:hypothetical protein